ncbi:GNAT family N-acetyltransferase, partial [Tyzzerella sp. OttesenSCG-928-J15]|nr:GNAT family N-acetyltransferase [Tyzzerella sp. OttesenSCG-928-J15]
DNLSENKLSNCDILEVLRRKTGEIIYNKDDGFLVYDTIGEVNFINAKTEAAAEYMLSIIKDKTLFCAHNELSRDVVMRITRLAPALECFQALYNGEMPPAPKLEAPFAIKKLEEKHIAIVLENYKAVDSEDYIKDRIADGMFGIFDGEILTSFIGKHAEGSMGLLYVLPEYRKKGFAQALATFMVRRCIENGELPYSQITVANTASYALHQSLGFEISEKKVYWLE